MSRADDGLTDLVARARAGDVDAFEALWRSHQAGVYSYIRSQVREAELAADLTQQAFVRAWESLPRLREGGAFVGWLYRIAGNLVRDEMKSARTRLEVRSSDMPEDPLASPACSVSTEQAVASRELRAVVWAALEELSPEQRAAVVMHHMEGMSVAEIARAAGVRPGTVMSRLARAREALRRKLTSYLEDSDAIL